MLLTTQYGWTMRNWGWEWVNGSVHHTQAKLNPTSFSRRTKWGVGAPKHTKTPISQCTINLQVVALRPP